MGERYTEETSNPENSLEENRSEDSAHKDNSNVVSDSDRGSSLTESDPFAYLQRNDFTSEKFKIEIRNLPKYYGLRVGTL